MYEIFGIPLSERRLHSSLPYAMSYRIYHQKEGRKQMGSRNKGRKKWWTDNGRARGNGRMKRNKPLK